MVEAERLFVERHRPLDEPPRPCKVALSLNKKSEVVEAGRRVGMFRAEPLLAHCQYALKERPRLRIGSATVKIPSRPIQKVGAFRVRSDVRHTVFAGHKEMRGELRTS
jgi:hypothetical protein